MTDDKLGDALHAGLQSLAESSFPKKCPNCGRVYANVEEYLSQTESVRNSKKPEQSTDDEENRGVDLFRDCVCGSTLLDAFNNRRDLSETGIRRREKFGCLLDKLNVAGFETDLARMKLLKLLRGKDSEMLKKRGFYVTKKSKRF